MQQELFFIPTTKTFKTINDLVEEDTLLSQYTPIEDKTTFTSYERKEVQQLVSNALSLADSPEDMANKAKKLIDIALLGASKEDLKRVNKIKAMRAALSKELFNLCGADTGYFKSDYAIFMQAKKDKLIGKALEDLENEILRITDWLKGSN